MLSTPTEYPHVGSYALYIDPSLPIGQQRAELVRIQRRDDERVWVSFPLRIGASGNKILDLSQLIDATPLDAAEKKEHAEIEAHLRGRETVRATPRLREMVRRSEDLRKRAIFSMLLASELAKLAAIEARGVPSVGSRLPRQAA